MLAHVIMWPIARLTSHSSMTQGIGGLIIPVGVLLLVAVVMGLWRRSLASLALWLSAAAALVHVHRLYLLDLTTPNKAMLKSLEWWRFNGDVLHDWNQVFILYGSLWQHTHRLQLALAPLSWALHAAALAVVGVWWWRSRRPQAGPRH